MPPGGVLLGRARGPWGRLGVRDDPLWAGQRARRLSPSAPGSRLARPSLSGGPCHQGGEGRRRGEVRDTPPAVLLLQQAPAHIFPGIPLCQSGTASEGGGLLPVVAPHSRPDRECGVPRLVRPLPGGPLEAGLPAVDRHHADAPRGRERNQGPAAGGGPLRSLPRVGLRSRGTTRPRGASPQVPLGQARRPWGGRAAPRRQRAPGGPPSLPPSGRAAPRRAGRRSVASCSGQLQGAVGSLVADRSRPCAPARTQAPAEEAPPRRCLGPAGCLCRGWRGAAARPGPAAASPVAAPGGFPRTLTTPEGDRRGGAPSRRRPPVRE